LLDVIRRARTLLRQILSDDAPPRRDRGLPLDLETVLLKALSRDPSARYQTAREMADDLRRFAADEPVRARRPGVVERAYRWAGKRRGLVAAVFAGLVLAVVGLSVGVALAWKKEGEARHNLGLANDATALAQTESRRAEKNWRHAWGATEVMFDMFAPMWGERLAVEVARLRDPLLKVRDYYETFAAENADAEARQAEVARAWFRAGVVRYLLDDRKACRDDLGRAVRLHEARRAAGPTDDEAGLDLYGCWMILGLLSLDEQDFDRAEGQMRRAVAEADALADDTPLARLARVNSRCGLARVCARRRKDAEAERHLREAVAEAERALTRHRTTGLALQAGIAHFNLGLHLVQGDPRRDAEAEPHFRRLLELQDGPGLPNAGSASERGRRAKAAFELELIAHAAGRQDEAEARLVQALGLSEHLAEAYPEADQHAELASQAARRVGALAELRGQKAEAELFCRRAIAAGDRLLAAPHPPVDMVMEVADLNGSRAALLRDLGRPDEAEATARRSVELWRRARRSTSSPVCREGLANACYQLATCLMNREQDAAARPLLVEAVSDLLFLPEDRLRGDQTRLVRVSAWGKLADLLAEGREYAAADGCYRMAAACWRRLESDWARQPKHRQARAERLHNWAIVLRLSDRADEADEAVCECLGVLERLTRDAPTHHQGWSLAAAALHQRALLLLGWGEVDAAVSHLLLAVDHQNRALRLSPGAPAYVARLRDHWSYLAKALTWLGRPAEAARARAAADALR
jgi:tetratricopeptide (TPR) repeat protein